MILNKKDIFFSFAYFLLSAIVTWWFIVVSPLYISDKQMLLSCFIAGGKWMIQIVAGFCLLKEKKWPFIRSIAFTCGVGSIILLPYCISSLMHGYLGSIFFIGSLIVSVLFMIFLYYNGIRKIGISLRWWFAWLFCLAIAISLQLTVVFHIVWVHGSGH